MRRAILIEPLARHPSHFRHGVLGEVMRHEVRVAHIAEAVSLAMGLEPGHAEAIGRAAALHDVGKLLVPAGILAKAGRLSAPEMAYVHQHPKHGHDMLAVDPRPDMQLAARVALEHHENWDGGGYPRGLKGEGISREARIVALCDSYDAVRSARPYKPACDHDEAMARMLGSDGRTDDGKFDPALMQLLDRKPELLASVYAGLA